MLEYDFENSLGFWICGAGHALRRSMNVELAREGITYRQWEVLVCVALGDSTQKQVADRLGIEAPTLVGVLERMERAGWLERFSCTSDRRKKRIRVTEKVKNVLQRMVECAHRVRAIARGDLTDEELKTLKSLCERILKNVELGTMPLSPAEQPARECGDRLETMLVAASAVCTPGALET